MVILPGCASSPVDSDPDHQAIRKTDNQTLVEIARQYGLDADETLRGVRIFLPKLTFDYNSVELSSLAERKIHYIAQILESQLATSRAVVLSGHADSLGTPGNNLKVSKRRAEEVAARLVGHGVDPARITREWHGDEKPIIPNKLADGSDNPEGRAVNRRVEVIILNP